MSCPLITFVLSHPDNANVLSLTQLLVLLSMYVMFTILRSTDVGIAVYVCDLHDTSFHFDLRGGKVGLRSFLKCHALLCPIMS